MGIFNKIKELFRGSKQAAPSPVQEDPGVTLADYKHVHVVKEEGPLKGWVFVGESPTTRQAFYVAATTEPKNCAPNRQIVSELQAERLGRLPSPDEFLYLLSLRNAPALKNAFKENAEYLTGGSQSWEISVYDTRGRKDMLVLPAYSVLLVRDAPSQ